MLTPLMPSLETTHPNCDAAIPGPPWNAPFCALRERAGGEVQLGGGEQRGRTTGRLQKLAAAETI